ncbi:MAG TPA: ABC transporter substrate-binding protein [Gemmatimonadaceae bacterium]
MPLPAPPQIPLDAPLDRRRFLGATALCAAAAFLPARLRAAPAPTPALRVGLLLPPTPGAVHDALRRGAELGAAEAERGAQLLGGSFTLLSANDGEHVAAAARRLVRDAGAIALVGGGDEAGGLALATLAPELGVPALNVAATADALRGAACATLLFHVAASDAMRRDALAGHPGARRALLWHPALERYGAAQLNDRFRARFDAPMDGAAWAAWFALKALWEGAARAHEATPRALAAALAAGRFDGHKGAPLSFRAWDRQLRQPLYLVGADARTVLAEVPAARHDEDATVALDRLGATARDGACHAGAP